MMAADGFQVGEELLLGNVNGIKWARHLEPTFRVERESVFALLQLVLRFRKQACVLDLGKLADKSDLVAASRDFRGIAHPKSVRCR